LDKKSLQRLIIVFCIVAVLGLGLLIAYYFYYSSQTQTRHANNIENTTQTKTKTLDELVKEQESNLQSTKQNNVDKKQTEDIPSSQEYKDYTNDQLNVSSLEKKETITNIYNQAIQQIRISSVSLDFNKASELANKTLSEHVFEDGQQYSVLSSISFLYGLNDMKGEEKFTAVALISDPVVYMVAFYSMEPEYQIESLKNEKHIYIPINTGNQPSLISVEKGGAAESRASEFFSNLTTCEISKIKIEVAGTQYYVYVTGKKGYSYKITNIEMADKTINARTTYSDYFKMWGRKTKTTK